MVARTFLVRHKTSLFPLDCETEDGLEVFKFQLYSLTSVPPDSQKIYGDGNLVICNDADLETIAEDLRLVSLEEDEKEEELASTSDAAAIVQSDEELARILQADDDALFQECRAGVCEDRAGFEEIVRPYGQRTLPMEKVECGACECEDRGGFEEIVRQYGQLIFPHEDNVRQEAAPNPLLLLRRECNPELKMLASEEALAAQADFQAASKTKTAHTIEHNQAWEALAKAQAEAEYARKEAAIANEELSRAKEALVKAQAEVDVARASQVASSSSLENVCSQLAEALAAQADFQAASRTTHMAERNQAQEALARVQAEVDSVRKEAAVAHEELSRTREALVKAQTGADAARATQATASGSLLAATSESGADVEAAREIASLKSENNALKSQLLDTMAERFRESQMHAEQLEKLRQEHAAVLENERARRSRLRDQIRAQSFSLSWT